MTETNVYKIRPAARHILTIGRNLIQNQYAALVELVKNSYDADSSNVSITFQKIKEKDNLVIVIEDNGHGMTEDVVIKKWLVPSTEDKLKRKTSPNGRIMQGRKGIGRYAASLLGNDLLLETIANDGKKTEVYLSWDDFEDIYNSEEKYLDQVEILVNSFPTREKSGTKLTITGDKSHLAEWDEKQIQNLKFELKKLMPPLDSNLFSNSNKKNDFKIQLIFKDFFDDDSENTNEIIEPYPILDLFDYKISGKIKSDGSGSFNFYNQRARNTITEKIFLNIENGTNCGELFFDIRVYDREADAIEQLIQRGLKDDNGNYIGKIQARQLLNSVNGIGVYRNDFRIRPLGDPDFDWLKLNEQRIQKPATKIGSNQVVGFVVIQSEEKSNLEEKSARDGLRENFAYQCLKKVTLTVLAELENRRAAFRLKTGLSRPVIKIERELEKLFNFDDVKKDIKNKLLKNGIKNQYAEEIVNIITQKEVESNEIVEEIRKAVAIYQGQATLGKIINVILHEGRRPLNYFKNQIPNLNYWVEQFNINNETSSLNQIIPIVNGFGENAENLVSLFKRIDPLASGKRGKKGKFNLYETIVNTFKVFEVELNQENITFEFSGNKNFIFDGWRQDLYLIITNLLDNSIFWMSEKNSKTRKIKINLQSIDNKLLFIDYQDTGPGIEKNLIESEIIFEPEFSTKINGTGLGLAIAGEAASRNNLELKAFESDTGAYFRIQPRNGV